MDEDTWYQCKQCQDKFKTTAELQKHNRVTHRSANRNAQEPVQNDNARRCKSCNHKFDTSDPGVLLLLRESNSQRGILKCPFCVKVRLIKDVGDEILDEDQSGPNTEQVESSDELPSVQEGISPQRMSCDEQEESSPDVPLGKIGSNLSMRRRSLSAGEAKRTKTFISSKVSKIRKSLLNSHSSKRSVSASASRSKVAAASAYPTTRKNGNVYSLTSLTSPASTVPSTVQTYETYQRSGGGMRKSNSTTEDREGTRKVAVLINNNPIQSSSRLAVPKLKEYAKGDIKCQYCGFLAKSFREVQFHINTHMAKSYPCEFCPKVYRSKQGVVQHQRKHHADQIEAEHDTQGVRIWENEEQSNHSLSTIGDMREEDQISSFSNSNTDSPSIMDENSSGYYLPENSQSYQNQMSQADMTNYSVCSYSNSYISTFNDPEAEALYEPHEYLMVDGEEACIQKIVDVSNF